MRKLTFSRSLSRKLVVLLLIASSALCVAIVVLISQPVSDVGRAPSAESGRDSYQVVHGWPNLPDDIVLGQVSGVDVDSHDHVFVFRRAENSWLSGSFDPQPIASPTVMIFDGTTGELLSSWGEGMFVMPHGLTVDREDNIWLTDVGLHQVFKFDPSGKLLLTVGERGVPGLDGSHFNRPTDVAVASDGSFYVSDGYINSRVAKFSPEGRFLFEWGTKGKGPAEFDLPHSVALDSSGRVYVADRSNARVQIFDSDGRYLTEWKGPEFGRPWAVRVGPDGYVYVVDGGDHPDTPPDRARVLKVDLNGEIIDSFGSFGDNDGQFMWPHDIAVAKDGAVYVGEVSTGTRVQKFVEQ